jgi:hypothetical protein
MCDKHSKSREFTEHRSYCKAREKCFRVPGNCRFSIKRRPWLKFSAAHHTFGASSSITRCMSSSAEWMSHMFTYTIARG